MTNPPNVPECFGCRKAIRERFLLKALDHHWHEDCLKCACCDCRLGEVGSTLFTKGNLILCKRDYLRWVIIPFSSWRHDRTSLPNTKSSWKSFRTHECTLRAVGIIVKNCDDDQAVWYNWIMFSLQQDNPSLRNGHAGQRKCLSSGMFCLPTVQSQVWILMMII